MQSPVGTVGPLRQVLNTSVPQFTSFVTWAHPAGSPSQAPGVALLCWGLWLTLLLPFFVKSRPEADSRSLSGQMSKRGSAALGVPTLSRAGGPWWTSAPQASPGLSRGTHPSRSRWPAGQRRSLSRPQAPAFLHVADFKATFQGQVRREPRGKNSSVPCIQKPGPSSGGGGPRGTDALPVSEERARTHRAAHPSEPHQGPPTLPLLASQPWRTPPVHCLVNQGCPCIGFYIQIRSWAQQALTQVKLLNPAEPPLSQEITKPQDCGNLLTCA